jgi:zinc transport system substrate-binding protein
MYLKRFLLLILFCHPAMSWAEPIHVFTGVTPMAVIAERVGGDLVQVQTLVRPGFDPHHYEPTPQQIRALSQADMYVRSALSFEQAWLPRIRGTNPDLLVIDTTGHDHHEHHPGHAHTDPHAWTDPNEALEIAKAIRDALGTLAPGQATIFQRNYAQLRTQLQKLDAEIRDSLKGLSQRSFLVFHPAWQHFAEAYDLQQIAIEHEGKQPGARSLARLVERARQKNIRTILVQPQMDTRLAEHIAKEIGAQVIEVDPLAADYPNNLRALTRALLQAPGHE